MAAYQNASNTGHADSSAAFNSNLKSLLETAKGDTSILRAAETGTLLANEIGKKLIDFSLKAEEDLDISRPPVHLGMDSLVAIEMRSWWKQAFGCDISVLEMLGMGTLEALGKHAAEGLLKLVEEEDEGNKSSLR